MDSSDIRRCLSEEISEISDVELDDHDILDDPESDIEVDDFPSDLG